MFFHRDFILPKGLLLWRLDFPTWCRLTNATHEIAAAVRYGIGWRQANRQRYVARGPWIFE